MVRLQTFNQCNGSCRDISESLSLIQSDIEKDVTACDRKHVLWGGCLPILDDQLPNQMVESGANSEKKITDNCTEFRFGLGCDVDSLNNQIKILVVLGNHSALAVFDQGQHPRYLIKMFLCPIEFQSNAVQTSRCHEDNLQHKAIGGSVC